MQKSCLVLIGQGKDLQCRVRSSYSNRFILVLRLQPPNRQTRKDTWRRNESYVRAAWCALDDSQTFQTVTAEFILLNEMDIYK